jgi:ClpP class serine protease
MREQFINKLVCQSWNIDKARGRALLASLVQRLRGERPAEDAWGDPLPKMQIVGDVAVIPIYGVLALAVPDWVKEYGVNLTDVNDIAEEILSALRDSRVTFIVLDFDSPGGWSIAGNKLFDVVEKMQAVMSGKPIFAWCSDGADVCSAAYQGASPARMFLTAPYAMAVGCIGTYQALLDDTKFWEMMGIEIKVLRSGELKAMGEDGFSEDQLAWMQKVVDQFGARFRANVSRYRTALDPAEMEGQYYDGAAAAKLGFTHGTAVDLNAALVKFRRQL